MKGAAIKERLNEMYSVSPFYFIVSAGMLFFSFVFLICCFLTAGHVFNNFLWFKHGEYFRDFFDSVFYASDDPYTKWHVIYPGVAMIFYTILAYFLCNNVDISGIPDDLAPYVLRDSQYGLMLYMVVVLLSLILIKIALPKELKQKQCFEIFFTIVIVLSAPVLLAIERGNNILLVVAFCLIFLKWYNSENIYLCYIAIASLAIATAFKLYPAIFAFLLLKERQYAYFVKTVLILALTVVLSTALLGGGPVDLVLSILTFSYSSSGTRSAIYSLSDLTKYLGIDSYSLIITGIVVMITLIVTVLDREMYIWMALCLLSAVLSICNGIGTPYLACNMIIPMVYFITYENDKTTLNMIYCVLFIGVFAIIPVLDMQYCYPIVNTIPFVCIVLLWASIVSKSASKLMHQARDY